MANGLRSNPRTRQQRTAKPLPFFLCKNPQEYIDIVNMVCIFVNMKTRHKCIDCNRTRFDDKVVAIKKYKGARLYKSHKCIDVLECSNYQLLNNIRQHEKNID